MAENVLKLKKKAVGLGMSKADAMKATREELEAFISDAAKKTSKKSTAKKAGKKSAKKAAAPVEDEEDEDEDDEEDEDEEPTPKARKKPGRKKGAKSTKKTAAKKPGRKPAKMKKDSKPARKAKDNDTGRAAIGKIDWSAESDDWNPRKGGPTEKMFRALKKAKGDVDKAYEALKSDLFDFVGKSKRDGTKRTKPEAQAMLRYRLNRTKFEFAVRTGQHNVATNRVEYGTGDYAKPKKTRKTKPAKSSKKTAAKKRGKTKKSKKK